MKKSRKVIIDSNEISVVKTYKLSGYDQKVLIEGKTKDLPILITLHGGPGSPIPFCVGGRGLFPDLTNRCILVSWDQYGCGINNAVLNDNITINDFREMTKDLVCSLKEEFPNNKIFLFGMSWGSILAAKVTTYIPDDIDGVIIYGQVVKKLGHSEDVKEELLNSTASSKVKKRVQAIFSKEKPSLDEGVLLLKWIRKYTQGYQNKKETKIAVGKMIMGIMSSPDYSFKDFAAIVKNGYLKNRSLITELLTLDLSEDLLKIQVPYHIIQGDTDIVTSTREVSKFLNDNEHKYLKLKIIENAGHIPAQNGMDAVLTAIEELVC